MGLRKSRSERKDTHRRPRRPPAAPKKNPCSTVQERHVGTQEELQQHRGRAALQRRVKLLKFVGALAPYGETSLPPRGTGARSIQQFGDSSRTNVNRSSRTRRPPVYSSQRCPAIRKACSAAASLGILAIVRCGM